MFIHIPYQLIRRNGEKYLSHSATDLNSGYASDKSVRIQYERKGSSFSSRHLESNYLSMS